MNQLHDRETAGGQLPAAGRRFISLSAGCFIGSMAIGDRVREARDSKGLTQPQLAYKSGVSERALRDIESGVTKNPSTGTVKRLAVVLEVPPEQLMGDEPIERPAPKARHVAAGPKSAREAVLDEQHYLQYLFKRAGLETTEERIAAAAKLDERYRSFETVTPALVDLWLESYVPSRTSRKQRRAGP